MSPGKGNKITRMVFANRTLIEACEYAKKRAGINDLSEEAKNVVGDIISISGSLGMTSLSFIGRCDFDGCIYDSNEIIYESMVGSNIRYPYNSIQYHFKKEWMARCFRLYFRIEDGNFPNSDEFGKYHNLPQILKVPRSDGSVQDAVTTDSTYGIHIRRSKSNIEDKQIKIYSNVMFNLDKKELDESDIETISNSPTTTIKEVLLTDLIKVNPDMKGLVYKFKLYSIPINDEMNAIQKEVCEFFNRFQRRWCEDYLKRALDEYKMVHGILSEYEILEE